MSDGYVDPFPAPRFFCWARWRCYRCDSPWFGATTGTRAWELLKEHWRECQS